MRTILFMLIFSAFILFGCSDDETPTQNPPPSTSTLQLNISGLEDLGSSAKYEGWIIVNGSPVSTGTFTVNAGGTLSQTDFEIDATDLANATTFVLTIEPNPDTDPNPSAIHILAGDFNGNTLSSIVDAGTTYVIDDMVKILSWYDNEAGYSSRMVDLAVMIGATL